MTREEAVELLASWRASLGVNDVAAAHLEGRVIAAMCGPPQPFVKRVEIDGASYEHRAPTLEGLLALLRAERRHVEEWPEAEAVELADRADGNPWRDRLPTASSPVGAVAPEQRAGLSEVIRQWRDRAPAEPAGKVDPVSWEQVTVNVLGRLDDDAPHLVSPPTGSAPGNTGS